MLDHNQPATINQKAVTEDKFFTNYHLYAKQEEESFKATLQTSKDHIFTIKYQTMYLDDERECLPMEILPVGLSMNDYDIRYDKNQDRITEIRHK